MRVIVRSGDDGRRWSVFGVRRRILFSRTARAIGKVIEWLCTGGRPLMMFVLATAIVLWLDRWALLLLYSALLLIWLLAKAKTRVVIETFEDHTSPTVQLEGSGDGSRAADGVARQYLDVTGMSRLLATQLTEMRNVYQLLQEPLGRPHPGSVEGAVQLEDIGDVLRAAFTTQAMIGVGPIKLPIGSLMTLLGRLMQAPHLRGGIYGDDTELILTAALTMKGRDYVWRVTHRANRAETPTHARAQMVAELAYRVFTELSLRGQAEWPATRYWLDALKERQACQRTPHDRRLHLDAAETHLRNALAEDERFYLAAYNLGIVYQQLAEEDAKRGPVSHLRGVPDEPHIRSALRVFDYAINTLDRERWEAYYGLALAQWKLAERSVGDPKRRHTRVVNLCDRSLQLAAGRTARAQILDLKAMAQAGLGLRNAALMTRHNACSLILRELAIAELWRMSPGDGQRAVRLRKQASQCLLNLAIAYDAVEPLNWVKQRDESSKRIHEWRRQRRFARIWALATAAEQLADVDAAAHARFAVIARRWGKFHLGENELHRAIAIDPDNPAYVALRAVMLAATKDADASQACIDAEHAIDFAEVTGQEDSIRRLTTAYRLLGNSERVKTIRRRREFALAIANTPPAAVDAAHTYLRGQLSQRLQEGCYWEAAMVERHLGRQLLRDSEDEYKPEAAAAKANEAEKLFADAIGNLGREHAVDIRRWGLLGDQARAIAGQQDRTGEALPLAERAVAIDPLSPTAWRALAIVRQHGGDYEGACTAWRRAHLIEPEDADCRVALALCQWQHALWLSNPADRSSLLREALSHLRAALRLYDTAHIEQRRRAEWLSAMCLWLLSEYAEMPGHLSRVLASFEKTNPTAEESAVRALVELVLAQSYRQTRHFSEAELYAQRSIDDGERAAKERFPATAVAARMGPLGCAPLRQDRWSLAAIRVLARAELAGCHVDRNGSMTFADKQCHEAERLIHDLDTQGVDVTEIHAEVLTERGRIELARGHTREAVHRLERATRMDSGKADSYIALAAAYERLATEQNARDSAETLRKARDSCRQAKEIVGEPHVQWSAADKVEQRLNADERARQTAAALTAAALIEADRQPATAVKAAALAAIGLSEENIKTVAHGAERQ